MFDYCMILFTPLSAMVAIWHHITVSFNVLALTGRVHWDLDILDEMHQ